MDAFGATARAQPGNLVVVVPAAILRHRHTMA
jgi:hypothetical protein